MNIFVATLFASFLSAGSISCLYYAERLIQFPLGLFGAAIGTSVLPRLTRQSALEDWAAFRRQVAEAVELVWFLTVPAAIGLWVIRGPLVHLLFQRGEFTEISTLMTAEALGYYTLGLWAVAGSRVLVGAWFALGQAYIMVWAGLGGLAINVVLSALFIGPMKHGGLALATSIAAVVNFFLLILLLDKRIGGIYGGRLFRSGGRCLLASLLMGLVVGCLSILSYSGGPLEGVFLALAVLCWVAAGVGVYLGSILFLGLPEGVRNVWAARRQRGSEEG
jgi:putative peptidoglycan lipid II flippase